MITIMELVALLAEVFLPAQGRGSAGLDMPHYLSMRRQDRLREFVKIFGSVLADDVRQGAHKSRITLLRI
jgi:hypothetical protein